MTSYTSLTKKDIIQAIEKAFKDFNEYETVAIATTTSAIGSSEVMQSILFTKVLDV